MLENRRVKNVIAEFKNDKGAIFAVVFLLFIITLSIIAPLLPLDPTAIDISNALAKPSAEHWFGTDKAGRDYLIRTIYGGRVSLTVGILSMLTSVTIGVSVGTLAGYYGGIIDNVLMRIVDILSSIPWMILITVMSVLFKPGFRTIILVIGLFTWMQVARLVRAETLSVKERDYVIYSKFLGVPSPVIIVRHIVPAVFPTIIVAATSGISSAIMTESSLSFLGLGIVEPMSSWGSLLNGAQDYIQSAIHMSILPGLCILLTVFSFNKLGNVMRVFAEPKVSAGDE